MRSSSIECTSPGLVHSIEDDRMNMLHTMAWHSSLQSPFPLDGQTDGIAVANTALARAVKTSEYHVGLPATRGSLVFSRIVLKVDRTLGEDCLV